MTTYLDTSAINHLNDKTSRLEIEYLKGLGIKFYISSLSLWEILLSSDKYNRMDKKISHKPKPTNRYIFLD